MTNERNFTTVIPGFYRTRDGQLAEVVQILDPRLNDAYPARGLASGLVENWRSNGIYHDAGGHDLDLITFLGRAADRGSVQDPGAEKPREKKLVTKTVTRWVNIEEGGYERSFFTKREADGFAELFDRIACVELTGTYTAEEIV